MRVSIIGGTQFIGLAIAEDLIAAGHQIAVIHRGKSEPPELADIEHHHLDRRDSSALGAALEASRPDVVIDTCAYDAHAANAVIAALPAGCRVIALSSMDVYRAFGAVLAGVASDPLPIYEDSPLRAERYPYRGRRDLPPTAGLDVDTYDKIDVEECFAAVSATILRLPMVYGERDPKRREEPILRRVRAGRGRIPIGTGNFLWTRAWVRDVAVATRLCAETDAAVGQILNIGESRTETIARWARAILAAAGSGAQLCRVPDDAVPPDLHLTCAFDQHVLVDSSRARTLLGWEPTPTANAVGASVAWHLANPPEDASTDFSEDDQALESLAA